MSQIEQRLGTFLSRRPEIAKCYRIGLVNRRALARYLLREGVAAPDQFESILAALRRHDYGSGVPSQRDVFRDVRIGLKDKIVIWDLEKDRALLERLGRLVSRVQSDRGDTLKIVVGTSAIKLVLDRKQEAEIRPLVEPVRLRERIDRLTEVSLMFPEEATRTPGVVAALTQELFVHDVLLTEILTASPELLLYVSDDQVTRAYEVVRGLRETPTRRDRRTREA